METSVAPRKYKLFNTSSIISQNTRSGALNISPAQLLQVKKEICEEKEQAKGKKISKAPKSISVDVPKPKAKRKFLIEESDSENTPSSQPVKKTRTLKSKASASLPIFSTLPFVDVSSILASTEVPIAAIPISAVQGATEQAQVQRNLKKSWQNQ